MGKRRSSSSTMAIDGLAALTEDIRKIESGSQVPVDLDWHVYSDEEAHKMWYEALSKAWKSSEPTTPRAATELVYNTIDGIYSNGAYLDDIQGFLCFYGLPFYSGGFSSRDVASPGSEDSSKDALSPRVGEVVSPLEFWTLPVTGEKVIDGVSFSVSVSVEVEDFIYLPREVLVAVSERRRALAKEDKHLAEKLLNEINNRPDYEVVDIDGEDFLCKKYKIKLRGIRAPETDGTKLRDELARMLDGKYLTISVYSFDEEGYCIGDVYRNDKKLQEILVKKGYRLEKEKEPLQ